MTRGEADIQHMLAGCPSRALGLWISAVKTEFYQDDPISRKIPNFSFGTFQSNSNFTEHLINNQQAYAVNKMFLAKELKKKFGNQIREPG